MKNDNNKNSAKKWFHIGEEELKFAKSSFEDFQAFYPQICFQCQQAVEKYLKGYLVFAQGNFPKVHDLTHLLKLCSETNKDFLNFLDEADILGQYYITSRYPLVEYPPADKEEAKEALEVAENIINFIKKLDL